MKRSQINDIIKNSIHFIDTLGFKLPPFAYWSPREWKTKGAEYNEIRETKLGWDITDFGSEDFKNIGLLLFTLRNGILNNKKYFKPYSEKILVVEEEQQTPLHFHKYKMEDIINRGGGNLMLKLMNSIENGTISDTPVNVSIDGKNMTIKSGSILKLSNGESITIPTYLYHSFWAEKGQGKVLLGEVSQVNDDLTDNYFYNSIGRFPDIEEDVEPLYLLCNEYRQELLNKSET